MFFKMGSKFYIGTTELYISATCFSLQIHNGFCKKCILQIEITSIPTRSSFSFVFFFSKVWRSQ